MKELSAEQIRNRIVKALDGHHDKNLPIKSITKTYEYSFMLPRKSKALVIELENGQRFTITVND